MATSPLDQEIYRCRRECGDSVPAPEVNAHRRFHRQRGDGPPDFDVLVAAEDLVDERTGDGL